MQTDFSDIHCVADMNITGALDQCLKDLALPELFIQRAKQITLADKQRFLRLRPVTKLVESRALIYRIYVPSEYRDGVMARIVKATDLKMGGRGCIFTKQISLHRSAPLGFDTEKLDRLCGRTEKTAPEKHALISCTVPRGSGNSLAEAVLELGICVPVIFFGTGVGLRDKLGLMRITIPVEKEIIWFLVPRSDAELVAKTLIPRARLDVPGQGFLYKNYVYAPVVNLRIRQGKRMYAASMEQVIAAMDEVRGSSDWRRLGSRRQEGGGDENKSNIRGIYFIGEEADVELFRKTAMECGARGATLNYLEMHSCDNLLHGQAKESHSRQLCDIIAPQAVEEKLHERLTQTGFFDSGRSCVIKTFDAEIPATLHQRNIEQVHKKK